MLYFIIAMCRRKLKENRLTGKKATPNKGFNKNVNER